MMKNLYLIILFCLSVSFMQAQTDSTLNKYIDNGLISIADKDGMTWSTKKGDFLFKPYTLIQTRGIYNYYDDEGLSPG